jgi:acetyl esterase
MRAARSRDCSVRRAALRVRTAATHAAAQAFFEGLSRVGRLHPRARPELHGVHVIQDVPYLSSAQSWHRLDIYRPLRAAGPSPAVLYLHGGAFRMLSKETHWLMALLFARAGYVVFNVSYRLAPRFPFPAAVEDACDAFTWLVRNARAYDVDPARIVLAGESAGANLAAALCVATCYERPEPYARRAFAAGMVPCAMVLGCGVLQVSDPGRIRSSSTLDSCTRFTPCRSCPPRAPPGATRSRS